MKEYYCPNDERIEPFLTFNTKFTQVKKKIIIKLPVENWPTGQLAKF
jgi:hypothetical protein